MKVKIISQTQFGNRWKYIKDPELREAYTELTGSKALTIGNINALAKFGVEFEEEYDT